MTLLDLKVELTPEKAYAFIYHLQSGKAKRSILESEWDKWEQKCTKEFYTEENTSFHGIDERRFCLPDVEGEVILLYHKNKLISIDVETKMETPEAKKAREDAQKLREKVFLKEESSIIGKKTL